MTINHQAILPKDLIIITTPKQETKCTEGRICQAPLFFRGT